MGAGFYSYKDTTDFLFELRGLKFDAIHYMPYHPLISHERIVWSYEDLAERSTHPVWLYFSGNWSQTLPFAKLSICRHIKTYAALSLVAVTLFRCSKPRLYHVQIFKSYRLLFELYTVAFNWAYKQQQPLKRALTIGQ